MAARTNKTVAPAVTVEVIDIEATPTTEVIEATVEEAKPSWDRSLAMGKGRGHTYRLSTRRNAHKLGYELVVNPETPKVDTYVRGEVTVTFDHSDGDFCQRVTVGDRVLVKPNEADKWKRGNRILTDLAK